VKLALAIAAIAITWSAAVYLDQRKIAEAVPGPTTGSIYGRPYAGVIHFHPFWEDPVAVLLAIGGLAAAVAITATGHSKQR
jgi:hypothetical protein